MKTTEVITASRYVGDERDLAFYIVDSAREIIVMTGATLSCTFSDQDGVEADVVTAVTFASGDGRLHIAVSAAQVTATITWKLFITGTDGSGADIPPIIGSMTVVAP